MSCRIPPYPRNGILTSLSLHRTHTRILKKQPVIHLKPLPRAFWVADLVLGVVPLDEVLHDTSALKEIDRLSVRKSIRQCGDPPVGVDFQEPWLFLCVFGELDFVHFVWQAGTWGAGQLRGFAADREQDCAASSLPTRNERKVDV